MPQEMNEGTEITSELEEEIEVVVEEEQEEQQESPPEPEAKKEEDELENYSASVNKRISKLTAKMREAERREQAAVEYARSVQTQLDQQTKKSETLDNYYVNEFQNRLSTQQELLASQMKEAIDRGDSNQQVDLQKKMAELATEEAKMKQVKQQQSVRKRAAPPVPPANMQQQTPPPPPPSTPQPQQAPPAEPDPKAQAWTERNTWFGENEAMTLTAFSIHKKLIEEEGYDPSSDEYYDQIDNRIRQEFPNKFEKKQSSSPKVAGASRGSGSKGRKSVKLNPSQVAIANKLGVPLEKYAAQLERMNQS